MFWNKVIKSLELRQIEKVWGLELTEEDLNRPYYRLDCSKNNNGKHNWEIIDPLITDEELKELKNNKDDARYQGIGVVFKWDYVCLDCEKIIRERTKWMKERLKFVRGQSDRQLKAKDIVRRVENEKVEVLKY